MIRSGQASSFKGCCWSIIICLMQSLTGFQRVFSFLRYHLRENPPTNSQKTYSYIWSNSMHDMVHQADSPLLCPKRIVEMTWRDTRCSYFTFKVPKYMPDLRQDHQIMSLAHAWKRNERISLLFMLVTFIMSKTSK